MSASTFSLKIIIASNACGLVVDAEEVVVEKKVLNKPKYKRGLSTYVIGKSACRPYNFR